MKWMSKFRQPNCSPSSETDMYDSTQNQLSANNYTKPAHLMLHYQLVSDTYELFCLTVVKDETAGSFHLKPPHSTLLIRVDKQVLVRSSEEGIRKVGSVRDLQIKGRIIYSCFDSNHRFSSVCFRFLVLCSLSLVFSALFFITLFYISYIQSIALNQHLSPESAGPEPLLPRTDFLQGKLLLASLDTIVCSPVD